MSRRQQVSVIALAVVLGLLGASCTAGGHKVAYRPPLATTTTSTTSTTAPPVQAAVVVPAVAPAPTKIALAAVAKGGSLAIHPEPGSSAVAMTLTNPTIEGVALAMLAVDQQGDWLQVRLPIRPNGSMGWVRTSEVDVKPVDNRIVVSVSQRSLRVLDKAQTTLYETNVAVGKPATPTPLGRFFVDIWVPHPGGPYGPFMLSIGGFSDVLKTFGGGRGQVAMHGWADPSVMGKNVSNGCVRMRNADIAHVATLAPLGTPVEIIA